MSDCDAGGTGESRHGLERGGRGVLGRGHAYHALDVPGLEPDHRLAAPSARARSRTACRSPRPPRPARRRRGPRARCAPRPARSPRATSTHGFAAARSAPGRIPSVVPPARLGAAAGGLHHAAEPAADHHRAAPRRAPRRPPRPRPPAAASGVVRARPRATYGRGSGLLGAGRRSSPSRPRIARRGSRRRTSTASEIREPATSAPAVISTAPASASQMPVSRAPARRRPTTSGGSLTSWTSTMTSASSGQRQRARPRPAERGTRDARPPASERERRARRQRQQHQVEHLEHGERRDALPPVEEQAHHEQHGAERADQRAERDAPLRRRSPDHEVHELAGHHHGLDDLAAVHAARDLLGARARSPRARSEASAGATRRSTSLPLSCTTSWISSRHQHAPGRPPARAPPTPARRSSARRPRRPGAGRTGRSASRRWRWRSASPRATRLSRPR